MEATKSKVYIGFCTHISSILLYTDTGVKQHCPLLCTVGYLWLILPDQTMWRNTVHYYILLGIFELSVDSVYPDQTAWSKSVHFHVL